MKMVNVAVDELVVSDDLRRSGRAKQFEERLRSSIEEIGLAEPLKVALMPSGQYLVVDGQMRLRAITAIREKDETAFITVPTYLIDFERRFEIRYQSDIYQDLQPSQLASLVEHLHKAEQVKKADIARYIGVSPATLRNYTGLWRLTQRHGLFEEIVELMDVGVFPASNPFAWLRLRAEGLRFVLEEHFADDVETAEEWVERTLLAARQGRGARFTTTEIESVTGSLIDELYREGSEVRSVKKDLGTRRAVRVEPIARRNTVKAVRNLNRVSRSSCDPVLKEAARSLKAYLQ